LIVLLSGTCRIGWSGQSGWSRRGGLVYIFREIRPSSQTPASSNGLLFRLKTAYSAAFIPCGADDDDRDHEDVQRWSRCCFERVNQNQDSNDTADTFEHDGLCPCEPLSLEEDIDELFQRSPHVFEAVLRFSTPITPPPQQEQPTRRQPRWNMMNFFLASLYCLKKRSRSSCAA
jgi:hypothetical protein